MLSIPAKYTNVHSATTFRAAFGIREYAELGRALAALIGRATPFSRSYVQHVLMGHYAPSRPFVTALSLWARDVVERRSRGRLTARVSVRGGVWAVKVSGLGVNEKGRAE